jgi:hypothetical protein
MLYGKAILYPSAVLQLSFLVCVHCSSLDKDSSVACEQARDRTNVTSVLSIYILYCVVL